MSESGIPYLPGNGRLVIEIDTKIENQLEEVADQSCNQTDEDKVVKVHVRINFGIN